MSTETRVALLPPELAARYAPERALGAGGFGSVVLALDRELGRPVAIKLLAEELESPEQRARFEREARVTAQLKSPHVVEVYEHGLTQGGRPFIVYEYVLGRDLAARVGDELDPARVARWARETARALAAAHAAGVVHRDVKPENVLVRDRDDAAVLCDFGVARLAEGGTVLTAAGMLLGTPAYMAPELWAGRPPSPASDQFAWAAAFHALLGGGSAYGAWGVEEILPRLKGYRAPELPGLAAREPALARALRRALAADPGARFGDLGEAARLLEAGATPPAATRVVARPARPSRRRGSRARRALAGLGLLGAGALAWRLRPAPPPPAPPPAAAPPVPAPDPVATGWAEVQATRAGLLRNLGLGEVAPDWRPRELPDRVATLEPGLHEPRTLLKLERFLRAVLAWEQAVRRGDGFRREVPGPAGGPGRRQWVRLRDAGLLVNDLLDTYGELGDLYLQELESSRLQALEVARKDLRGRVGALLQGMELRGPEALAAAAFRWMLARDTVPDIPEAWVAELPGVVVPASPAYLVEPLQFYLASISSREGGYRVARAEGCELGARARDWAYAALERALAHPGEVGACRTLTRVRISLLEGMARCGDDPEARRRYARLLAEEEPCLEALGTGWGRRYKSELKTLARTRFEVAGLPRAWTTRLEELVAQRR